MAPPPPMPQPALPPMREVTEDTPPDMLAGAMDLRVLLPDGHAVKMSVDRSTPMMDLLVHVTTANKMSPGSHVIQAVGEKGNILPYKPSTPIGALDTWTIQIVSKSKASVIGHKKAPLKPSNQPFEQTFRLQVNLPRNQLFVTRVSPRTPLLDVLRHVCTEKGLDPDKYELRNPMNPDEILRLTCNLLDYKLQEVTVVLRGGTTSHHSHHRLHATSPADIISLQQQHQQLTESSDKRRKSSCSTTATSSNSGGVFGFIFKRSSRSSVCEGSISSDSLGGQSISPARSDESLGPARSASPPLPQAPSRTGASQDHLRNQINNRMSRQQENSCCLNSVLSESGEGMEEIQPPPPPVRQRKRRAPKPPVQHAELSSGNKKTSEFITPDPPSVPAPIPVARRKSTPVEDDEYEEEDVGTVGGGRKAKMDGGGASGTVISHSRNSSDSSGYHEASVLSESPESGLGGSGAPDTLPRRKQQHQLQQQRAAAASSSQMPAFSRSMGNLASVAPAPSSTTTTSKTLISPSYSSLSVSTSSLPGQKKKKAPAPPPPTPSGKANEAVDKSTSKTPLSTGSLDRTRHNGREDEPALLERDIVHKPKVISKVATEQTKPVQLAKQKEPPLLDVKLPVTQVDQKNNASLEKAALPPVVALSASKPPSANKLGPAVAPKPKANSTGRPGLQNGPENEAGEANEGTAEEDMVDFVDDVQQIEETLIDEEIKPLVMLESEKKLDDYDLEKESEAVIASTFLPSPPPSLEYMGPEDGGDMEERVPGTEEDLEWEYKLPAPPTGFEDEEEKGPEEVKEGTWVAETASTPSTFSSSTSHRKVWTGEGGPMNHLPNFRMSTYKIPSSEGWEDPREFLGNQRTTAAEAPEKPRGSTFVTLNSGSTGKEEREPNKGCLETWASVSSKSSISSAPSTNMDLYNPTPYSNPGFKDAAKTEINGPIKNGSYVVRVSSFGGKSSMNLKRSLSSTSSLVSRHSNSNGREKLDKGPDASQTVRSTFGNEKESHSLSNASRTVSLHDLAVNSIVEENRVAVSLSNGYHKENTTPKIVSSTWKKPQGNDNNTTAKYPSPDSHNLRKTSSELSISQVGQSNGWKGVEDEDEQVAILQQQFLQWHEQMLQNKTTLDGSVSLKSLQVLRGVLPQLKKSLSSDLADKDAALITTAKRKDSGPRKADSRDASKDEGETFHSLSATTESNYDPSSNHESFIERTPQDAAKRYSYAGPPAINFGTWSERPKSEVSLKRDSDYRIGVGQAPRLREAAQPMANPSRSTQPPQCEVAPPCPPPKPSNRVVVNIVSATKQEPVSRLPIVRSVELKKTASSTRTVRPMSGSFPNDLREELTGALASLVDANRSGIGKDEGNERRKRQQIPCSSAVPPPPPEVSTVLSSHPTNLRRMGSAAGLECGSRLNGFGSHEKRHTIAPVVKGFRVNSMTMQSSGVPQAPPPPPPAIVCGVALKKKAEPSIIPKFSENPRDQLLTAIREFGGRESLKKTAINYK